MKQTRLFDKRLQFFTGKGGVGKSSVAAASACLAAKNGRKTLLVEIDTASSMRRIFDAPFVGFVPLEVIDGVWVININPEEALVEYIEELVKVQRIARAITHNHILQYFFKAAPAVNELVALNKIYKLSHDIDKTSGLPVYDTILVDLPATGHALTFLNLPNAMNQLVGVGPIRKMVEKYRNMLMDKDHTCINLVTLAEDMPVSETIELYQYVSLELGLPMGHLFVNAVNERLFEDDELDPLARLAAISESSATLAASSLAAQYALHRQEKSEKLIGKLRENVTMRRMTLPHIPVTRFDYNAVRRLCAAMADGFGDPT